MISQSPETTPFMQRLNKMVRLRNVSVFSTTPSSSLHPFSIWEGIWRFGPTCNYIDVQEMLVNIGKLVVSPHLLKIISDVMRIFSLSERKILGSSGILIII